MIMGQQPQLLQLKGRELALLANVAIGGGVSPPQFSPAFIL